MTALARLIAEAHHAATLVSSGVLQVEIVEASHATLVVTITVDDRSCPWGEVVEHVRARLDDFRPAGVSLEFVVYVSQVGMIFDSRKPARRDLFSTRLDTELQRASASMKAAGMPTVTAARDQMIRRTAEIYKARGGDPRYRTNDTDLHRVLDAMLEAVAEAIADALHPTIDMSIDDSGDLVVPRHGPPPLKLVSRTVRIALYCGHVAAHEALGSTWSPPPKGAKWYCRDCAALMIVTGVSP